MTNQLPPTTNPGLKQTLVSKKLRDHYRGLLTLHYRQFTILDDFYATFLKDKTSC